MAPELASRVLIHLINSEIRQAVIVGLLSEFEQGLTEFLLCGQIVIGPYLRNPLYVSPAVVRRHRDHLREEPLFFVVENGHRHGLSGVLRAERDAPSVVGLLLLDVCGGDFDFHCYLL